MDIPALRALSTYNACATGPILKVSHSLRGLILVHVWEVSRSVYAYW